jgi:hypothetical protein
LRNTSNFAMDGNPLQNIAFVTKVENKFVVIVKDAVTCKNTLSQ